MYINSTTTEFSVFNSSHDCVNVAHDDVVGLVAVLGANIDNGDTHISHNLDISAPDAVWEVLEMAVDIAYDS